MSTYLFKVHFNTRQFVRDTLSKLDEEHEEWFDDYVEQVLQCSVRERLVVIYDHEKAKTAGTEGHGATREDEVERVWSRCDQIRRHEEHDFRTIDIKRRAAHSSHAALVAVCDLLGMCFYVDYLLIY